MTRQQHLHLLRTTKKTSKKDKLVDPVLELLKGTDHRINPDLIRDIDKGDLEHIARNLETLRDWSSRDIGVKFYRWLSEHDKPNPNLPPIDFKAKVEDMEGAIMSSFFEEKGNWRKSLTIGLGAGLLLGLTVPGLWTDQIAAPFTGAEPYPNIYRVHQDAPNMFAFLTNRIASAYLTSHCDFDSKIFSLILNMQAGIISGIASTPAIRTIYSLKRTLESDDLKLEPEQFKNRFRRARISRIGGLMLYATVLGTAISGLIQGYQVRSLEQELCTQVNIPIITQIKDIKATSLEKELKQALDPFYWNKDLRDQVRDGALEVYFPTGNAVLATPHQSALRRAIGTLKGIEHYVIEGHADFRGEPEDNYKLGLDRAIAAAEIIKRENPNARITTVSVGEKEATETRDTEQLARDRKARLLLSDNPVELGVQKTDTSIYFVDNNYGMQPFWRDVQRTAFPSNKVWVSGDKKTSLQKVTLGQTTDLYEGLCELLRQSGFNTSITIVTAGSASTKEYDLALQTALGRKISVSVVGLGLDQENVSRLGTLAQQTGGVPYFISAQSE
ncbi:MAG: OmpA family protein [Candidatus Woesearchaeota archaeon]